MNAVSIREVIPQDAATLHSLAHRCPPLDCHTPYTYWVLCSFSGKTCLLLESDGAPVGFITSIVFDDILFLWQIGILSEYRHNQNTKESYAMNLLEDIFKKTRKLGIKRVQTTITCDNTSSMGLINRFANKMNLQLNIVGKISDTSFPNGFICDEEIYEIILGDV